MSITNFVYIKNATGNIIKNSLKTGYNESEIKLNEADGNLIQEIQETDIISPRDN